MTSHEKITHVSILSQVLQNYLGDDLANGFFKQSLKQSAKNFLNQLREVERKQYDSFFKKEEESTLVIYDIVDSFCKTISTIPIYEMQNIQSVLEAYQKDSKSIEGIVKKILK